MRKAIIFLIYLMIATGISKPALAQGPTGYNKETNLDWFEICSPDDYEPYVNGFYPETLPGGLGSAFLAPLSAGPVIAQLGYASLTTPYLEEGVSPDYDFLNQCLWNSYVESEGWPGDQYDQAYTAAKDFVHPIQFADVSFLYSCYDPFGDTLWRPYRVEIRWEDEVETVINGSVCSNNDPGYGYITQQVRPRSGHTITRIRVSFDNVPLDIPIVGDWLILPMPDLYIDRLLIRGFWPQQTISTPTPTATRTPAPTTAPTVTNTPRSGLWNTPTPGTPIATKVFPKKYSSIPTAIPPLIFPTWPAVAQIPTPQPISLLIPTPPERTPVALITLAPLDFSAVGTPAPNPSTPTPGPWTAQIISYTTYLSESTNLNPTETFTILNAPADYAPDLPRPFANIGYTFENMGSAADNGVLYTLHSWAALVGYSASLPVQFIKMLHQIVIIIGPVGLFIIWLLIMLPFRLWIIMFIFIKNAIVGSFNMVVKIIRFIGDIWDLIPGL